MTVRSRNFRRKVAGTEIEGGQCLSKAPLVDGSACLVSMDFPLPWRQTAVCLGPNSACAARRDERKEYLPTQLSGADAGAYFVCVSRKPVRCPLLQLHVQTQPSGCLSGSVRLNELFSAVVVWRYLCLGSDGQRGARRASRDRKEVRARSHNRVFV